MNHWQYAKYTQINKDESLPLKNETDNLIVVGCNYHTTWQSKRGMRFILDNVIGKKGKLITRNTDASFWVNLNELIFIQSTHNYQKAKKLRNI